MSLVNFITDETVEAPITKVGTRMRNAAEVPANSMDPADLNLINTKLGHVRDALRSGDVPFAATGSTTARTLAQRFAERVSVLDFGGAADGVTDCTSALLAACEAVDFVGTVRFPYVSGSANTYRFSTFFAGQFGGITFDVDEGVTLSTNADDVMANTAGALRFARPTRFHWRTLQRDYVVSASKPLKAARPPPTKGMWLDDAALDRSTVSPVLCNTSEVVPRKIGWATSDAWAASAFDVATANAFRLAPGVAGDFHLGMRRVLPGDEMMATFAGPAGAPLLAAMVRTTEGFYGVFTSSDGTSAALDFFSKTTGVAGTSSALAPLWKDTHASYAPANAVWAVRVDAWNRATILLNGWALASFTTAGAIHEVGFGLFATGAASAVSVENVTVARGKKPTLGTLLSVGVFGDSRSAPRYDCWPDFLPEALEYTAGIRCWKVDNRAVAGEASAQQLARLTSTGVAAYDVVAIDVGTNDVQGSVPVSTFLANVTGMVDAVLAAGKTCVLVNFDLWYEQGQSGGTGQASSHYADGAPYRSALIRLAAEKGVKLLDAPALSGPILAHYVNPALGVDLTAAGDSALSDNIHPTSALTRLRAREVAKAIAGALLPGTGSLRYPPTALTGFANGWTANAEAPKLSISAGGTVCVEGLANAGTKTAGTTVLTLPAHAWPRTSKRFLAHGSDFTEQPLLTVDSATGDVKVYSLSASTYVSLDAITFNIDDRPLP